MTTRVDLGSYVVDKHEILALGGYVGTDAGLPRDGKFWIEARDRTETKVYARYGPWAGDCLSTVKITERPASNNYVPSWNDYDYPEPSTIAPFLREDNRFTLVCDLEHAGDVPAGAEFEVYAYEYDEYDDGLTRRLLEIEVSHDRLPDEVPETDSDTGDTSEPEQHTRDARVMYADHFESDDPTGRPLTELEEVTGVRTL